VTATVRSLHQRYLRLRRQVVLPIAALVALAVGTLIAFLWLGAGKQDARAAHRSVEAVRHALAAEQRRLGLTTRDYSWWDDAVRYLDLSLDPAWADANVGPYPGFPIWVPSTCPNAAGILAATRIPVFTRHVPHDPTAPLQLST
jgi:hypothetical protein